MALFTFLKERMRNISGSENNIPFLGFNSIISYLKKEFAFNYLEYFILVFMYMKRRTSLGTIFIFHFKK